MAGKIVNGAFNSAALDKLASAYAEGRKAITVGGILNPHPKPSPAWSSWDAGANTRATTAAGTKDNCAEPVNTQVFSPTLLGMTSTAAQAEITRIGLTVGTITGASGVVTVQSPTAGSKMNLAAAQAFTIA